VRCQSEACAVYDLAERGPGTFFVHSKRYCSYCTACLWPKMVRAKVRKEHHILGEILRRVPELEAAAYHWQFYEAQRIDDRINVPIYRIDGNGLN
jgi:hypothetical protein